MTCFALADRLGKSIHEVMSWPIDTIYDWAAYIEETNRRRESKK